MGYCDGSKRKKKKNFLKRLLCCVYVCAVWFRLMMAIWEYFGISQKIKK